MTRWNPHVLLVLILVALAIAGPAVGVAESATGGFTDFGFKW
jgi:hypothetical protein